MWNALAILCLKCGHANKAPLYCIVLGMYATNSNKGTESAPYTHPIQSLTHEALYVMHVVVNISEKTTGEQMQGIKVS